MKPVRLEILIDDKTLQGLNSVKGNLGSMEQFYKQSIGQLKSELTDLQQKLKVALSEGINTDKQAAEIQALTGVVNQLTDELEKLKQAKKQNNATPIIGEDPAPKMNNIKMSMAQIARELPAITMGPQMFFLAISNNIPLLQDALSSARKEFNALTAAGKEATPVWKQVAKSIVSPQAAIAVGITLLTVYGDEIVSFAKKMIKGKDAVLSMKEAQEKGLGGECLKYIHHSDFIKRMDLAYAAADIVISRSGASSISELCAAHKASIFVPSPNVTEDHQTHNAMALVRKDAGMIVKDSEAEEKLMKTACGLIENPERIALMEKNIAALAKTEAAQEIVDEAYKIIG